MSLQPRKSFAQANAHLNVHAKAARNEKQQELSAAISKKSSVAVSLVTLGAVALAGGFFIKRSSPTEAFSLADKANAQNETATTSCKQGGDRSTQADCARQPIKNSSHLLFWGSQNTAAKPTPTAAPLRPSYGGFGGSSAPHVSAAA